MNDNSAAPPSAPQHLATDERRFGGELFWQALRRIAGQTGHGDHDRYLAGPTTPTSAYTYVCATCQQHFVAIVVTREP